MKIPQMITAELRRLTSTRMSVIALIALLAVPILYGGLYLWANQDPYGNLANVPVALVVDDRGADVNGQQRNLGDEAAEQLLDSDTFEWHRVSPDQADAGLQAGDFDFVVTLPADFTEAVASLSSSTPRQADIELRTNDANNYLASTIGTQAVARIQSSVAKKVVDEAGLSLLDALNTIRVKLVDATTGATQLVDGLASAKNGSSQLSTGSTTLADGAAKLADGNAQLSAGANQLRDGTAQLRDGSARVADGAQQVAGASTAWTRRPARSAPSPATPRRSCPRRAPTSRRPWPTRGSTRPGSTRSSPVSTPSESASRPPTRACKTRSSRSTSSTTVPARSPPAAPPWPPVPPAPPTAPRRSPTAPPPRHPGPPSSATDRRSSATARPSSTTASLSSRRARRSCATVSRRA